MSNNNNNVSNKKQQQYMSTNKRKQELLSEFKQTISLGYSEETWVKAASIYNDLKGYLSLSELKKVGEVWRNTYTNSNFFNDINSL
jgi:hypothetical protein